MEAMAGHSGSSGVCGVVGQLRLSQAKRQNKVRRYLRYLQDFAMTIFAIDLDAERDAERSAGGGDACLKG
jgi:hypothetical protein